MKEKGRNRERERGEGTDHGQTSVIYHILKVVESDNKKWLSGNNAKFGATTLQKKTKRTNNSRERSTSTLRPCSASGRIGTALLVG